VSATDVGAPEAPERGEGATRLLLPISGMHCAGCVASVEKAIAAVPGVRGVEVNLVTGKAAIVHEGVAVEPLVAAVERAGYAVPREAVASHTRGGHEAGAGAAAFDSHGEHVAAERAEHAGHVHDAGESVLGRRFVVALAATAVVMLLGMGHAPTTVLHARAVPPLSFALAALATLVVLGYSGADYYRGFVASVRRRAPDMNTLIASGATAAFLLSVVVHFRPALAPARGGVYFDTAAMIVTLLLLGRLLEARARRRALSAIAELSALAVREARVVRGGEERLVPIEAVAVGEEVVIRAGESVPVDGVVVDGTSAVDESLVTGESLPVTRGPGDRVIGGTVNGNGLLRARVTATGEKTMLAAITRAVEEAQAGKAPIQRLADRIASVFVPAVFAVALATVAAWAIAGGPGGLAVGLVRAVAVLMIACPCALGLATPMALVVGTGRGARAGILFRDGEALERAARLRKIIFDKTGTLTEGKPRVAAVAAEPGFAESEVIALAAAVESGAAHPVGAAILAHAEAAGIARPRPDSVLAVPGLGVAGRVGGRDVLVGSARFLASRGVSGRDGEGAESPGTVRVAVDGRLAGTIRVADRVRPEAVETLRALRALGVSAGMITGDVPAVARAVGEPLGLDPILAGTLPSGKADAVRALGAGVGMVGDGVNDAPALSAAEVGIAMAGGTDVARAASGVTLVRPDLRLVPAAIRLARATRAAIRRNLLWAFLFNVVGIPLAAGVLEPRFGISISPEFAAFAMAMSSVIVVLSSLTLRGARLAAAAALVAGALAGVLPGAGPAAARADDLGDNPFDVTAVAIPTPGDTAGDYRIEVRFGVPPGHYLYRERTGVVFPAESSISAPAFPPGVVQHDKFEDRDLEIYPSPMRVVARLRAAGRRPNEIFPLLTVAEYQGCTHEFCFFPQSETLRVAAPGEGAAAPTGGIAAIEAPAPGGEGAVSAGGIAAPGGGGSVDIAERLASKGYLLTFLGVFLSGILLSFTPCVFPMIPITVSVIGARKTSSFAQSFSLSLVYVLGLALTYAVLGVVAARTGALFGAFLQNPWVVGFVVIVLSALALSMFGLYEIQVPAALASRLQGHAGGGHGFAGVFFMGIVAGLVASPCVGPVILGLLLFIATTGSIALGFSLLLTLGLGMGVLFLVIGTFSGALSALPRAGFWMDAVKELFGVLLLGMGLYFLRPLLDPILFALIAGLLLLVLAGFGGVFEPGATGWLGRARRTILLVFLALGIALTGGAVREAGFLLPKPRDGGASGTGANAGTPASGIPWIASESDGIEAARLAGRPVMIDFTADWCLACHELDDVVFHDPRVVAAAKDYVAIRLDFTKVTPEVRALQQKYSIRGLPTILFLDREGRVRDDLTVTGFVKPEDFLERMRSVG